MAKYLVTGGCGFIGSHLADALLAEGHKVRIVDDLSTGRLQNAPKAAELMIGDVSDPLVAFRAMSGVNGCFHLAAVASVERCNMHWLQTHRVNASATVALMEAARVLGGNSGGPPFVYASSAAVYGDNDATPLDETAATRPLTAYGADKLSSEQHARVAGHVHGVPTAGLRFFNVYGSRQDPKSPYSGVISIFADRLSNGQGITIFGDGTQVRDFVHVSDVVARLKQAMWAANRGAPVFNVCTGNGVSILELAAKIGHAVGAAPEIAFGPKRAGDIMRSLGDPSRANTALGARSMLSLSDGLALTLKAPRAAVA